MNRAAVVRPTQNKSLCSQAVLLVNNSITDYRREATNSAASASITNNSTTVLTPRAFHDRILSISDAEVVRVLASDAGYANAGDATVQATAFLSDDLVFVLPEP